MLADNCQDNRLNTPNDVVVKSDDSIWFTDPDYGFLSHGTGDRLKESMAGAVSSASISQFA